MAQMGVNKPFYEASNVRAESFASHHVPNSDTVLSWPYKTPSPEFMSKLGFYFEPTARYKDRVRCISCNKLTSTWKNCKDPVAHHLKKSPHCWLSRMHKHIRDRADKAGHEWKDIEDFRDPLSTEAVEIRRNTFGNNWPYDRVEGANPTSDKMIDAGFYYYPQVKDDDLVMCIYCGVSLEGWELDDDPLFEHRKRNTSQDCYFLHVIAQQEGGPSEVPVKRSNSAELESSGTKKSKLSPQVGSMKKKETIETIKPRRARERARPLVIDMSDSDEEENDSFSITSNEDELLSDEEYTESSVKRDSKSAKSTISRKSTSTIKNSSRVLTSPKKSKILDSSFEENGLFSNKNLKDAIIEQLPQTKTDNPKPRSKKIKTKKLLDITNISTSYISDSKSQINLSAGQYKDENGIDRSQITAATPKGEKSQLAEGLEILPKDRSFHPERRAEISVSADMKGPEEKSDDFDDNEEDENDSIILVSNSKDSIIANGDAGQESASSSPVMKKSKRKGKGSQSKQRLSSGTMTLNTASNNNATQTIDPRNNRVTGEHSPSNDKNQPLNKSILSQSRFLQSPTVTRSKSPFLDDQYKGSDDISVHSLLKNAEPLTDVNDIPIEESTDHNIQTHFRPIQYSPMRTQEPKNQGDLDPDLDLEHRKLRNSGSTSQISLNDKFAEVKANNTSSDDFFHTVDHEPIVHKEIFGKAWIPTNTNNLFEPLEDLETAKNYIAEIKDIPYELHNDIDGRISYFINEIPDEELEMTIDEWIKYSAKQGRNHFEQICQKMIDQFDSECDRALERLRSLSG